MKNFLNSVKVFKPRSNQFDLSHDVKLSCNMGYLIPTLCLDLVPGDSIRLGCEALTRLAPMVAPMMHRVDVYMHYFFVPNRLLWENWKNFITNTKVAGSVPAFPWMDYGASEYTNNPILDYMGLPKLTGTNRVKVNAMPFAAYNMIYNEYYRDQNLCPEVNYKLVDGDNGANVDLYQLYKRAWEHDYFTAALPFAQKGDAVEIPMSAEVKLANHNTQLWKQNAGGVFATPGTSEAAGTSPGGLGYNGQVASQTTGNFWSLDPNGSLEVQNADTNINDLRKAYALQRFLEKLARGGSRLTEFIKVMFGVQSSDARLQRPEYITGSKSPIVVSEVLNTTGTVDAPQGAMAGHGAGVTSGNYGHFFAEEHGYVIGILSVMPKTAYQQGVPKHFLKINNAWEYFTPDFANIGEQEIQNQEVYADDTAANREATFGYIPRYGEYKFMANRVAGDFKSTLDFWHMGRIFSSPPALNQQFIEADPTFRIYADTTPTDDHLWMHVFHDIKARRLMPKYGTPTF